MCPALEQGANQQLTAIENSLDLQPQEFIPATAERVGRARSLLLHECVNRDPHARIGDAQEPPRLGQTDAGGGMCALQDAPERLGLDGCTHEATHIATLANHTVDRRAVRFVVAMDGVTHGRNRAAAARGLMKSGPASNTRTRLPSRAV